jgi:O-acetyl-ADP-ribose deacetylase (regulator of RNase III)
MAPFRAHLEAIEDDIAGLEIVAIVNAANEPLIMGGDVDGAIRRRAGPEMETELRRIGRCATGEAVLTRGHRLPAKFVIHTAAPVWHEEGATREAKIRLLGDCYRNALTCAHDNGISEIAFPCIGTGIYGWPPISPREWRSIRWLRSCATTRCFRGSSSAASAQLTGIATQLSLWR